MLRRNLCASIAVCIVVPLSTFSQNAQPRTDTPQTLPVIRRTARVVNVNVLVADRKGRPVQGLTKNDFQIFDNGHQETVAFFSTRQDKADGSDSVRDPAADAYTNDPQRSGEAAQGATVILFDTVNTAYLSQAYSLGRIRIFLRQLQPQDRVGIYVLNEEGLKVVYGPGQRAAALLGAIQGYDETQRSSGPREAGVPSENSTGVAELDRFLQGKDDRRPLAAFGDNDRPCDPQRFLITIAAFQQIARRTAGLGGRKAVIWVTQSMPLPYGKENAFDLAHLEFCGMPSYEPDLILEEPANVPLLPGSRSSQSVESGGSPSPLSSGPGPIPGGVRDRGLSENDELDLLLRLLTENNIALYPVSAEGLQTVRLFGNGDVHPRAPLRPGAMDATAPLEPDPGAMTMKVLNAVHAVANTYAHQNMEIMARRTGGRAYYDRNDLETGIRRALDDSRYGYELAYYPDHDHWNGDWRKIEVKVNRPGVTVLARGGYYAFPEARLLPPKASKQLIEEIAASPLEDTEIPITVKLTPPGGTGSAVEARVYLSAQKLFTSHAAGEWTSDFEVLFFQLTAKNRILDVATQNVRLAFAQAKYSEALKRGINTEQHLKFKPGAAVLYVIVHDKRTDAVGSVRIPLSEYSANSAPN